MRFLVGLECTHIACTDEAPASPTCTPRLNSNKGRPVLVTGSKTSRTKRWCCDYLRKLPSRHISLKQRIMGMRAEQSRKRSERPRIDFNKREQFLYIQSISLPRTFLIRCFGGVEVSALSLVADCRTLCLAVVSLGFTAEVVFVRI